MAQEESLMSKYEVPVPKRTMIKVSLGKREPIVYKPVTLKQEWCVCTENVFLCYPNNGQCGCGEFKHHVHCVCGAIIQTG